MSKEAGGHVAASPGGWGAGGAGRRALAGGACRLPFFSRWWRAPSGSRSVESPLARHARQSNSAATRRGIEPAGAGGAARDRHPLDRRWKRRWRRRGRTADLVRRRPRHLAALTGARIGWAEPSSLGAAAAGAVAPGSAPTHAAPPLTADAGEPVPRGHLAATSVRLGRGASLGRPGAGRRLPTP